MKQARKYVNENWALGKTSLVSGKAVIKLICDWLKTEFNISTNKFNIAREMNKYEIAVEMAGVITCIENRLDFPVK